MGMVFVVVVLSPRWWFVLNWAVRGMGIVVAVLVMIQLCHGRHTA